MVDAHFREAIEQINEKIAVMDGCDSSDSLRGVEGQVAKIYFASFDALILKQKQDFFMLERTRRPPLDKMNALLSFLYTVLANDVQSALEMVGLDPYVGFLHADRPGRASLALDIMEELRPFLVDRIALSLVNLNMIDGAGFTTNGIGVLMNEGTRKTVLGAWQKRKQEEIVHPYLKEKIELGLVPYCAGHAAIEISARGHRWVPTFLQHVGELMMVLRTYDVKYRNPRGKTAPETGGEEMQGPWATGPAFGLRVRRGPGAVREAQERPHVDDRRRGRQLAVLLPREQLEGKGRALRCQGNCTIRKAVLIF